MSALKRVAMVNIQSHTNTVIDLPQVGIVRFYGNNSNGKSVLVKALSDVVSNAISRPSNRRSLIRRGHTYGELCIQRYDDTVIFIRIALEASQTYAELTRPNSQPVRRYLADKSIPILVREFGWHYSSDCGTSLNIHQDIDSFLFVDTKKSTNFELLNSVQTDQFAEASVESLNALIKTTKKLRTDIAHQLEIAQATYSALTYWDVEKESAVRDNCLHLAACLELLNIPSMPTLCAPPNVVALPILDALPAVHYPAFIEVLQDAMPDIKESIAELQRLKEGICPLCERPFI